ncbi:hypothetical protein [Sulfurimonas sp.]|uniref:hypothetical protein n=1 Tax=Sulfurimonas sp. TaxID=2022749 RepID=UPI002AAF32EF|nr:hypothetical protein [Sulfurimonas sp.]
MHNPKIYYYVHTGHRIGLDRFRRACTILRLFKDVDITLLCSDFRIAQVACDFGIEKSVGIDVVRNIPQIANNGDKLIFDSDEANPIMLEDMKQYFSSFLHIKNEMVVVDDKYFEKVDKTIEMSLFFGDDDYEKDLEKNFSFFDGLDLDLQLGFYYFLDYEDMLREKFPKHHEFEEYDELITKSKILITPSPQAVLENLASGGKPIYIQREDYTDKYQKIFDKLNIPVIKGYDKKELVMVLEDLHTREYYQVQQKGSQTYKFIKENLNL